MVAMLQDRFATVLVQAQAGDAAAFATLWREGQPMLLRYLAVTAPGQAEDIASQTWLRVIERLDGFRGDEPAFRRWLVTIARNLYIDHVRRAARRPEHLVPDHLSEDIPLAAAAPDAADLALTGLSTAAALRPSPPCPLSRPSSSRCGSSWASRSRTSRGSPAGPPGQSGSRCTGGCAGCVTR
jgi:RNA polymerase sigma-70 factor (ECF subfamily)